MAVRKDPIANGRIAVKDCWHPYGLQGLNPEKFVMVTSKILKGKHGLIKFGRKKILETGRA